MSRRETRVGKRDEEQASVYYVFLFFVFFYLPRVAAKESVVVLLNTSIESTVSLSDTLHAGGCQRASHRRVPFADALRLGPAALAHLGFSGARVTLRMRTLFYITIATAFSSLE